MPSKDDVAGKQKRGSFRRKVKATYKSVKARLNGEYSKSMPVTVDNSRAVSFLSETGKDSIASSLYSRPLFTSRLDPKMESRLAKVDPSIFDEQPLVQRSVELQDEGGFSQNSTLLASTKVGEVESTDTNELSGATLGPDEVVVETELKQDSLGDEDGGKENVFPVETVIEALELDGAVIETVPNKGCQTWTKITIASDLDAIVEVPQPGEDNAQLSENHKPLSGANDDPSTNIPAEIVTAGDEYVIDGPPREEETVLLDDNQNTLSAVSDGRLATTETTNSNDGVPQHGVSSGRIALVDEKQNSLPQRKDCCQLCIIAEIAATSGSDHVEPPRNGDEMNIIGQDRTDTSQINRGRRTAKGRRFLSFVNRTVHVCALAAFTYSVLSQIKR